MITAATRVLRLRFIQTVERDAVPEGEPLIDFVAYARDCALSGTIRLDTDRLTDLLNSSDELDLVNVVYLALDGRIEEADRAVVQRGDLIAVKAGDPRGNVIFRHHTRQLPVVVGAEGYLMHGYIHGRPGADPMVHLMRRPAMVPLTDATILYETDRGWHQEAASTLIINRDAADWVRPAKQDERLRPPAA